VIIKFCLVFPKIFLLHKVVRDAKKVEKHCSREYCVFLHSYQCLSAIRAAFQYFKKKLMMMCFR